LACSRVVQAAPSSRVLGLALGAALCFMGATPAWACSATAGACTLKPPLATPTHPDNPKPSVSEPRSTDTAHRYAAGAATISRLADGQSTVIRHFPAAMGLNGYVVQIGKSRDVLLYTSRSGRHFFIGGIFSANGTNLSRRYAQRYLPAAARAPSQPAPSAAMVYRGIQKTTWFTVGRPTAPKVLWAGMDPNCIFCHETFERLWPYIRKGLVQLRIMPVGFLKPSSLPKAVTILLSKHPARSWIYDEQHFNVALEEGGIVPRKHLPRDVVAEVRANWAWMNRDGYYGTPLLVWLNRSGKPQVQDGMPLSIQTLLASVQSSARTKARAAK